MGNLAKYYFERFFGKCILQRPIQEERCFVTVASCNRHPLGTKCVNSRRDICKQITTNELLFPGVNEHFCETYKPG